MLINKTMKKKIIKKVKKGINDDVLFTLDNVLYSIKMDLKMLEKVISELK